MEVGVSLSKEEEKSWVREDMEKQIQILKSVTDDQAKTIEVLSSSMLMPSLQATQSLMHDLDKMEFSNEVAQTTDVDAVVSDAREALKFFLDQNKENM